MDSQTYKEIESNGQQAAWRTIEKIIKNQPESKEEKAQEIFNKFINNINDLYPGTKDRFEYLRPLIFLKILKNTELNDDYYNYLKEI